MTTIDASEENNAYAPGAWFPRQPPPPEPPILDVWRREPIRHGYYVPASKERHEATLVRYRSGESIDAIAASYGITPQSVRWHLRRMGEVGWHKEEAEGKGWYALLPGEIAHAQEVWELGRRIMRARAAGALYREIAATLGCTLERVRQRESWTKRRSKSPVERWLKQNEHELFWEVRRLVSTGEHTPLTPRLPHL